jgi:hypothetical protein
MLKQYANNIHSEQLFNLPSNFGRFVSRNIYWHTLSELFGKNATLFFLFNLSILLTNTFFTYKLFNNLTSNPFYSKLNGLIYFCSYPVVETFCWLSNSQHLLAHTFILLYLLLLTDDDELSANKLIQLMLIFIIGVYTNILVAFILPATIYYLFSKKKLDYKSSIMIAIQVVISLIFIYILSKNRHEVYSTKISIEQALINLEFYSKHSMAAIVIMVASGCYIIYKKDKTLVLLFILTISMYLPFAFAVYQRYNNYMALALLFWFGLLSYPIRNKKTPLIIFLVLMVYLSIPTVKHFSEQPLGAQMKDFLYKLNNKYPYNKNTTICLKPHKQKTNPTGLKIWNIPEFWWTLGFGEAGNLFLNPNISLSLLKKSPDKNCEVYVIDSDFNLYNKSFH